jgi:hypothetical protein
MLSEKYIMGLLKKYASSPEGKKAIKDTYGIDYNPKKYTPQYFKKWGNKMKQILLKHINSVIPTISESDIIVNEPTVSEGGKYTLQISFNKDALFRPSLNPDRRDWTGRNITVKNNQIGIEDIVIHFTYGWNARGSVYGEWHGENVWSRRSRQPNDFLERAIDEFNKNAKGVAVAELVGDCQLPHPIEGGACD